MSTFFSSESTTKIRSLPTWDYENWTRTEKHQTNSLKSKLLLDSLELIKDEINNGEACRKVVEQALKAKLFNIAIKAIYTFSPDSDFNLCVSISDIFKDMSYWKHLTADFISYAEQCILEAPECRSGIGFGGHFCDQRSRSLGYLGRYRFFTGNLELAISFWEAADDRIDIDEIIAEMCETIAKKSPQNLEVALVLIDMMQINIIKAKTMATLSQYA